MQKSSLSFLILASLALAGCAAPSLFPPAPLPVKGSQSDPLTGGYGSCSLPVVRDAGMGTKQLSCAAWTFGPNREQTARFNRTAAQ